MSEPAPRVVDLDAPVDVAEPGGPQASAGRGRSPWALPAAVLVLAAGGLLATSALREPPALDGAALGGAIADAVADAAPAPADLSRITPDGVVLPELDLPPGAGRSRTAEEQLQRASTGTVFVVRLPGRVPPAQPAPGAGPGTGTVYVDVHDAGGPAAREADRGPQGRRCSGAGGEPPVCVEVPGGVDVRFVDVGDRRANLRGPGSGVAERELVLVDGPLYVRVWTARWDGGGGRPGGVRRGPGRRRRGPAPGGPAGVGRRRRRAWSPSSAGAGQGA